MKEHDHFRLARLSNRDEHVLTRYVDVTSALRDPRFGYPAVRGEAGQTWANTLRLPGGREKILRLQVAASRFVNLWMPARQPPDHGRLRRVVADAFGPEAIAALRSRIQMHTDELIDRAEPRHGMDLIADLSLPVAVAVIKEIFGISAGDLPKLVEWSRDLQQLVDMHLPPDKLARGALASAAFAEYFRRKAADQDYLPDGLLRTLVDAQKSGEIDEDEFLANCTLLLFAGHETTYHLVGNGMLALLRHPDQLDLLRTQPELLRGAVEEMLRYDGPGQILWRQALADAQIGKATIRAGQMVRLCIALANRDPDQFPNPDRFDIRRSPNRHVGFGGGIHHCLGNILARLEASVIIGTLLNRLPGLALATDDLEWEDFVRLRGLKRLPVTF